MSSPIAKPTTHAAAPGAEDDLVKVSAMRAAEVLERYEPSERAAALAAGETTPKHFVESLIAEELDEDAIAFLAYALPRREALWWGVRCVREVTPKEPVEPIAAAIGAAQRWIDAPSDEQRRAAMVAAEAATYGTPAGCIALAVFFSEGSMAPPDCPSVPVGEGFCARTVAAAVLLSALVDGPDETRGRARLFARLGVEIASRPAPWEEPP